MIKSTAMIILSVEDALKLMKEVNELHYVINSVSRRCYDEVVKLMDEETPSDEKIMSTQNAIVCKENMFTHLTRMSELIEAYANSFDDEFLSIDPTVKFYSGFIAEAKEDDMLLSSFTIEEDVGVHPPVNSYVSKLIYSLEDDSFRATVNYEGDKTPIDISVSEEEMQSLRSWGFAWFASPNSPGHFPYKIKNYIDMLKSYRNSFLLCRDVSNITKSNYKEFGYLSGDKK